MYTTFSDVTQPVQPELSELTQKTQKIADDYYKAYDAQNSSLQLEASKDDVNKLILLLQNCSLE